MTVLGLGYVGTLTATCLAARGHRVVGVELDRAKVATINAGRSPVVEPGLDDLIADAVSAGTLFATDSIAEGLANSDISIICVGTPSGCDGSSDLRQIRRVTGDIGAILSTTTRPHTVVIRSTVPPGTIDEVVVPALEAAACGRAYGMELNVALCPGFLREGSGVADFFGPPFLVVGGTRQAVASVRELFAFLDCPVYALAVREAESIKYAYNAFHALTVSFTNELARLYRVLGVDSRDVMEIWAQDCRLNLCPAGLRPGFAFGGSRPTKDLRSLLYLGRTNSVTLPVLEATLMSDEIVIREVAERTVYAVESAGGNNRKVAVLGLATTHNVDDLQDSPNVALAEILIGKGLDVRIYDPLLNVASPDGADLRYVRERLPHLGRALRDDPMDVVDGAHVAIVFSADPRALEAVSAAAPPIVIDLNGRLDRQLETMTGYQGAGW